MKKRYNPREIEPKWQAYWLKNQTFKAEEANSKPKYYVLDMFPYPSGAGLHVGHVEGYTATDIIARYKRQRGFNVLHPMGWDSFGLPAEQYAIRTGTHPEETTRKNIDNFRRQLQSLGFSYDWSREIATSDPDYYKWTQWIFTKLYERGLAYQAEMQVNFCPTLGTVLANEEIENGKSIEGGYPVEKRPLKQWVLKITAYADRLIEDLDLVNWPESLKRLQRNWIGKSEGVEVLFQIEKSEQAFKVYTTRPDTLFGATFAVLAPEHPLVPEITSKLQRPVVEEYLIRAARKSDLERIDLSRTKTGVFTGAYAINPANGQRIPIWVADYILISYGTGAVMAVPCHDERDFEFAGEYDLPVTAVIDPDFSTGPDWSAEGLSKEAMRKEILGGRQCWQGEGPCINSSNEEVSLNGLSVEEAKEKMISWLEKKGLGKRAVNYKLRDWLFSRQRYWGEPFPILHFEDGTKRTLDLDELPLSPPEVPDYKPSKDGRSPLARVEEWLRLVDPKTGKQARRETDTMPQWAGSCWYYLRFTDPKNLEEAWSREAEQYWMPVDLYIGGVEHAVLHLLYARFWHKVLYDCGLVKDKEPFRTLRNQGIIVARSFQRSSGAYVPPEEVVEREGRYFHKEDGSELSTQIEKMSKSKLNGVTPDEIVSEFGADALRLYEMFMGPLEKEKIWNTDAVSGCKRFLSRFHDLFFSGKLSDEESEEALKLGYRLIQGVSSDIEKLQFNTAIAKMMEFLNDFSKLDSYPKRVCAWAVQVLSPFAPHLAEELWEQLGMESDLSRTPYPEVDPAYLVEEAATYVVQVNGKVRGRFELPKDQTEEAVLQLAKKQPNISKHLEGKAIRKVVFLPNKLLNIVAS